MYIIDSIVNCCKSCWNLIKIGSYTPESETKNLISSDSVEINFNQIYRDSN